MLWKMCVKIYRVILSSKCEKLHDAPEKDIRKFQVRRNQLHVQLGRTTQSYWSFDDNKWRLTTQKKKKKGKEESNNEVKLRVSNKNI